MDAVFRLIKLVVAALVLVPLLWAASCSLLGVGAAYAVKEAAGPISKQAVQTAKKERLRRQNERFNREASYNSRRYDYDDY